MTLIRTKPQLPDNAVTDPEVFATRRKLLKTFLGAAASGVAAPVLALDRAAWPKIAVNPLSGQDLTATPAELIKNYTNYYEFSFTKTAATELAQSLPTDPWRVEVSGAVETPALYYLEDLLRRQGLEERVYRFRCVEAWSAVIPWIGFPLSRLLAAAKPLSGAKFVKFTAVHRPDAMPKQAERAMLAWPYVEALRIDEAMHPLTILAVGMYGEALPKQNGAPLRLVVPWKYGFKSIKAVVKIELLEKPPLTTWNKHAPHEYGFYANVNPDVPHPRWSQRSERQLGSVLFTPRRRTELFNGYSEQVAHLYRDLNLRRFF